MDKNIVYPKQAALLIWLNKHLPRGTPAVQDVCAVNDGSTLPALIRKLFPQTFNIDRVKKKWKKEKHRGQNIIVCLDFLRNEVGLWLPEINAEVLKTPDGCIKLLSRLALYCDVTTPICVCNEYHVQPLDARVQLLTWANNQIKHKQVSNFNEDWTDGILYGALVNSIAADVCRDCMDWKPENGISNIKEAMFMAEQYLGVPKMLPAGIYAGPNVDELCVMLYVAQFINAKPKAQRLRQVSQPPSYRDDDDNEGPDYEQLDDEPTPTQTRPKIAFHATPFPAQAAAPFRTQDSTLPKTVPLQPEPDYTERRLTQAEMPYYKSIAQFYEMDIHEGNGFWETISPEEQYLRDELKDSMKSGKRLTIGKQIGHGEYGEIFVGRFRETNRGARNVALKTVKESVRSDAATIVKFLKEAVVMQNFEHENVMSMIAFVVHEDLPYIVLPYMENKDLLTHVRNKRKELELDNMLDYLVQVARGMHYLAELMFVHRDLLARNCMLDSEGVVKIGDFGFTRDILSGAYVMVTEYPVPFICMAPESLDTLTFTTETDVWAFGVLAWEVLTYGQEPYKGMQWKQMPEYLKKENRLPKPRGAPDNVYEILRNCWEYDPDKRPAFRTIKTRLEQQLAGIQNEKSGDLYDDIGIPATRTAAAARQHSESAPSTMAETRAPPEFGRCDSAFVSTSMPSKGPDSLQLRGRPATGGTSSPVTNRPLPEVPRN